MKAFNLIYTILFLMIAMASFSCSRTSFKSQKSFGALNIQGAQASIQTVLISED